MPRPCSAKILLQSGRRPSPAPKNPCGVCTSRCIYCDIWKLTTLVQSHTPLSRRPSSRLQKKPSASSVSSSSSSSTSSDLARSLKMLDAQFQTQRARLASILSICMVDGAEASEGLRLAHDRCLMTFMSLLDQEDDLEELMMEEDALLEEEEEEEEKEEMESIWTSIPSMESRVGKALQPRRTSGNCRLHQAYMNGERKASHMGMAM